MTFDEFMVGVQAIPNRGARQRTLDSIDAMSDVDRQRMMEQITALENQLATLPPSLPAEQIIADIDSSESRQAYEWFLYATRNDGVTP